MPERIFKEGDVVIRTVGGPLMTVEAGTKTDGFVRCIWFDVDGRVQRDCFAGHTLNRWRLDTEGI